MIAATTLATEDRLLSESGNAGCVLPPIQSPFTKAGRVIVTRDGLRISLHRRIWERYWGVKLSPNTFLLQACRTFGCVNPVHYVKSKTPYNKMPGCRNGHRYTAASVQPDGHRVCLVCKAERQARRERRGGDPNWVREKRRKFCPHGHEYTEENTYTYETKSGGTRRKCRQCSLLRSAGIDPATL